MESLFILSQVSHATRKDYVFLGPIYFWALLIVVKSVFLITIIPTSGPENKTFACFHTGQLPVIARENHILSMRMEL